MVALAVGLVFVAYGVGLTGYALVRGYNMTPGSLWNPVHPATWTTEVYTGPAIFPTGA